MTRKSTNFSIYPTNISHKKAFCGNLLGYQCQKLIFAHNLYSQFLRFLQFGRSHIFSGQDKAGFGGDTADVFPPFFSIISLYSSREWWVNTPLMTMDWPASLSVYPLRSSSVRWSCRPFDFSRSTSSLLTGLEK